MTISEAVGSTVAAIREKHGITQAELAQELTENGLPWSRARIYALEGGQRGISFPLLILLADALGNLAGEEFHLHDLLGRAEYIALTDDFIVARNALAQMLQGKPVGFTVADLPAEARADIEASIKKAAEALSELTDSIPQSITAKDVRNAAPTYAEKRAAKRLGIPARSFAIWAHHLWGMSLDKKAAEIAGVNSSPQARGHATRTLVEEVREHLRNEHNNG